MKSTILITAVSLILIAALVGGILYFEFLANPTSAEPLMINNLKAQADGQISFNVTVNDNESSMIEGVVINGDRYLWSHGSKEIEYRHNLLMIARAFRIRNSEANQIQLGFSV